MQAKLASLFRQLLSETGTLSMVRFLSLVCVVTAALLSLLGLYTTQHSLESVAILCGTFLGAGMGAKVLQKKYESVSGQDVIVPVPPSTETKGS